MELAFFTLIVIGVMVMVVMRATHKKSIRVPAETLPARMPTPFPTTPPTPIPPYHIEFVFDPPVSTEDLAVFESSRSRWTRLITADIATTVSVTNPGALCGVPGFSGTFDVDDLLILVQIEPIDGPGQILGQAGPCGVDSSGYVRVGVIILDSADFAQLKADGQANSVITHEIGHVIGIGTLWNAFGLVSAFLYQGAEGNAGNADIGRTGPAVIEDLGGPGTAGSHWKDSVYGDELMTGYLSGSSQPLSRLTARSLRDLGFSVDETQADTYTALRGRRLLEKRLHSDVRRGPIYLLRNETLKHA